MEQHNLRVVVVDDEAAIGQFISEACELSGIECVVTHHADHFRTAVNETVRAVFVDLMLPGTDGIEILRQLGEKRFSGAVVLLSGVDKRVLKAAADMAESLGLKLIARLEKPFSLQKLLQVLEKIRSTPPSSRVTSDQVELSEAAIHRALSHREVEVHFQPQIRLTTGLLHGFEALVRIRHDTLGIVGPGAFLHTVEKCGWADWLTEIVFTSALSELSRFKSHAKLSVNVAASSLSDLGLPDRLEGWASEYAIPPARLVVEVTETGLVQEPGKTLDTLSRLRLKGFGVSVDDFGTGYSSLAQLKTLPATELKIDRIFVKDVVADSSSRTMVAQTILMAHDLGLEVVAEGNETEAETELLRSLDCDLAQGFYFSKPLDAPGLRLWMDNRTEEAV